MFTILGWIIYGLVVGSIAKLIYPGKDPDGFLITIGIGVIGSFVGGFVSWGLGMGAGFMQPSGIIMGIIGGLLSLFVYHRFLK